MLLTVTLKSLRRSPAFINLALSETSDKDNLQVDVLVGTNYIWEFQGQEAIRWEKN